jgi:hypothetical protein
MRFFLPFALFYPSPPWVTTRDGTIPLAAFASLP